MSFPVLYSVSQERFPPLEEKEGRLRITGGALEFRNPCEGNNRGRKRTSVQTKGTVPLRNFASPIPFKVWVSIEGTFSGPNWRI